MLPGLASICGILHFLALHSMHIALIPQSSSASRICCILWHGALHKFC